VVLEMHEIDIDRYSKGNSMLHRLDARVKTLCAFIVILGIVMLDHWYAALSIFAISLGLASVAKAPLKVFLKRLRYPLFTAMVVTAIHPFTYGSHVIAVLSPLHLPVYQEGLSFGILLFTRIMAAVSVLNLLILITPVTSILNTLKWLRVPAVIITIASLMLRYIFVFSAESSRIYKAQQCRLGFSGSYTKKMKNYGSLGGMLILRSLDRTINVYKAMVSRGYSEDERVSNGRG
jgi:cobalt/nickel transport system permease protein